MAQKDNDIGQMPFERAIEELEAIVKRLEEGKVPLKESVAIDERGEALKRRCEELLRQAEARVDKITTDASGQPTGTEPLDLQGRVAPRGLAPGAACAKSSVVVEYRSPASSGAEIALCTLCGLL